MRQDAVSYLRDQLQNAIDNYSDDGVVPKIAIEAIVRDGIARMHMLNLILEETTTDDRAVLISWGMFVDDKATDEERHHWQIWVGNHGGWVTAAFLHKGTYGASLKDAPPGLMVVARYAPDECTAHLKCLKPGAFKALDGHLKQMGAELDEDAFDDQTEAMDYDHLNHPGR